MRNLPLVAASCLFLACGGLNLSGGVTSDSIGASVAGGCPAPGSTKTDAIAELGRPDRVCSFFTTGKEFGSWGTRKALIYDVATCGVGAALCVWLAEDDETRVLFSQESCTYAYSGSCI